MRLDRLAPAAPIAPASAKGKRTRSGFTLVELMVAMALSLFLMTILAEAFAVSMDTFRGLRAIGDMQDTLRNGLRQLRDDLALPHFEGERKLSDVGFWLEPRREGFFNMRGTTIPGQASQTIGASSNGFVYNEGYDGYTILSSRAVDHVIHFAVRRRGFRPSDYFTVGPFSSPGTPPQPPLLHYTAMNYQPETYYGQVYNYPLPVTNPPPVAQRPPQYAYLSSQWAEVAYLLQPMPGNPTTPESPSIPLYNLIRAQVLVLPYRDAFTTNNITAATLLDKTTGTANLNRISVSPQNRNVFNSPNDLALSSRGFNSTPPAAGNAAPSPPNLPSDPTQVSLVCSNVISFQVRLLMQMRTPAPGGSPLVPMQTTVFLDDIQNRVAQGATAIDTSTTTVPTWADPGQGTPVRIMGVQIRLRIYDPASGQARQNTLVQAL